jgi:hypothetical protein
MLKNSRIKSSSLKSVSVFGKGKSVFGSVASSSYIIILSVVFIAAVILIANKQQIQEGFFNNNNYRAEYYYMKGCGHCRDFDKDGIWEQLIDEGNFTKITLKKFDSDKGEAAERVQIMKITSFPKIIIVDNSGNKPRIIATFDEERTYDKLYNFIKNYDT